MSDVFFQELGIPEPDYHLGVGSGTHAEQTARIKVAFEKICVEDTPDLVVVVGDVNSTLACSTVAKKLGIPVAPAQAACRSELAREPAAQAVPSCHSEARSAEESPPSHVILYMDPPRFATV